MFYIKGKFLGIFLILDPDPYPLHGSGSRNSPILRKHRRGKKERRRKYLRLKRIKEGKIMIFFVRFYKCFFYFTEKNGFNCFFLSQRKRIVCKKNVFFEIKNKEIKNMQFLEETSFYKTTLLPSKYHKRSCKNLVLDCLLMQYKFFMCGNSCQKAKIFF